MSDPVMPDLGLPARVNMKRAYDIYVFGRNRTLGPAEKSRLIGGQAESPFGRPPISPVEPGEAAQVSVPTRLRFDRNAGTWRRTESQSKGEAR